MGQKIHPGGLRVGVIHDWKSNWYTGNEGLRRRTCSRTSRSASTSTGSSRTPGLSDILIRKDKQRITVDIFTARPGIVIGKSGVEVDALRRELHALTQKNVHININEIKRPELDAKLVAQSIAEQLENRVSFRRAMKRSLASAIRSGAQGIKIHLRRPPRRRRDEPLGVLLRGARAAAHIRADIDYGFVEAKTTFGRIGVKVWINKGEIMPEGYEGMTQRDQRLGDQDQARRRGGVTEGLGASRETGRGRGGDREGLGPVAPPRWRRRWRRRPRPEGRRRRPAGLGDRARGQDNVERPRTDDSARSAEGRQQPVVEPAAPPPVRDSGPGEGDGGNREVPRRRARWYSPRQSSTHRTRRRRRPCTRTRRSSTSRARRGETMLIPKKPPKGFRKVHRGRRRGLAKGQTSVHFGDYGLKALENAWVTNRQIEAARIAMTRRIKRGGKVWINLFPDKSVTQKPAETRMGSGKGSPEHWVAVVKPGRVMFELAGFPSRWRVRRSGSPARSCR